MPHGLTFYHLSYHLICSAFLFYFYYENNMNNFSGGEFAFAKKLFTVNDSGHANKYWPSSYPPKAQLASHVTANPLVAKFWNSHSRYSTRLNGKNQIVALVLCQSNQLVTHYFITGPLLRGLPLLVTGGSPHKGPVMRNAFQCYHIIVFEGEFMKQS